MAEATNTVRPLEPATKRCWKCETTKATADFNKDKSRQDGLQPTCRLCSKAARKAWLETHPDGQKKAWAKWYAKPENAAKHNAQTVQRNRETAQMLIERFKSAPCADCKGTFPTWCMDFDHRLGVEKCFEVKYRTLASKPLDAIVAEIAKCDLVCSNCHRTRTVTRNQVGRK